MSLFFILIIILTISSFLCLYRVGAGPTAADRMVAIDIIGTLVVGFTIIMTLMTGKGFYLNIAISWALLSFIGTLAVAKYLEGKYFDE